MFQVKQIQEFDLQPDQRGYIGVSDQKLHDFLDTEHLSIHFPSGNFGDLKQQKYIT